MIEQDFFGDGPPAAAVDASVVASDFAMGSPVPHGYHVLGTMLGTFASVPGLGADPDQVIGLFPHRALVRVVDHKSTAITDDASARNAVTSAPGARRLRPRRGQQFGEPDDAAHVFGDGPARRRLDSSWSARPVPVRPAWKTGSSTLSRRATTRASTRRGTRCRRGRRCSRGWSTPGASPSRRLPTRSSSRTC